MSENPKGREVQFRTGTTNAQFFDGKLNAVFRSGTPNALWRRGELGGKVLAANLTNQVLEGKEHTSLTAEEKSRLGNAAIFLWAALSETIAAYGAGESAHKGEITGDLVFLLVTGLNAAAILMNGAISQESFPSEE